VIAPLRLIVRWLTFAVALTIVAPIFWGLATSAKVIRTPQIAVWLFICGILAQLFFWLFAKMARVR
jgi:hypothetical protein